MSIQPQDISRAAQLARIGLNEADIQRYLNDFEKILTWMDQLQVVDTHDIEPLAHPVNATQSLRADEVTESDQHESFQRCAPAVANDLYLVPRVIE